MTPASDRPCRLVRFPLTGTPFRLNLTPNVRYEEDWYTRTERVLTDADGHAVYDSLGRIQRFSEDGFTAIRQVSAGLSANTEFFGTFPWRVGPLDGFRHIVRPSLSYTYRPDYSEGIFDYFESYIDPNTGEEVEYPIVSGVSPRETRSLSFRVSNVFQTRLARTDSAGAVRRTPLQLLTLDVASTYDFAADSLQLAPINVAARTQIGSLLSVNLDARFSPYALDETHRLVNRYYVTERSRLLRFLGLNLTARTTLRGSPAGGAPSLAAPRAVPVYPDLDDPGTDGLLPYDHRRRDLAYVDFAVPWSLGLDFSYRVTRNPGRESTVAATLESSFDLSLTPTWKIAGRTGYDFEQHEITTTRLSVLRDLHCWEMSFNWVPFGDFKSFGFSIYVKSGHLRDLLRLDVPKQERSGRFGMAGGGF